MDIFRKILLIGTLLSIQTIPLQTLAQEAKKDSRIPSTKDAIALMRGICGAGNISEKQGQISCQTCPDSTTDNSIGGTLTSVIYGNFTKAGNQEALVDLGGCEAHAANFGGTVLLHRSNNGWSKVRYERGLRSNSCLKIRNRTGRDSLICQNSYMGQGHLMDWIEAVEISTTQTQNTRLLEVESNTATCRPPYYEVQIKDFLLRDTNKDNRPDLIIKVSETREPKSITRSNNDQCDPRLPKPKQHQLTFVFNGQSFRPTAATTKLIRQLEVKP